ncbi:ribonuclease HII [Candidatus Peregrinibacteria bacterium]|nr:ribonuclease HII [Candidatus Peregrinibacteria bacterium]
MTKIKKNHKLQWIYKIKLSKKTTKSPKQNQIIIAGLDEVGRGPWAGPIVACAYIETKEIGRIKITDSKQMNFAEREKAYDILIANGIYGLGLAEPAEIDKFGLANANRLAFKRAIKALSIRPDLILIDGKDKLTLKNTNEIPFRTIIKGDSLIKEISCASIIAKVYRDRLMCEYALQFPQYKFEKNKGYGTVEHHQLIKKHGICKIHRKSFKPVFAASFTQALPLEELHD